MKKFVLLGSCIIVGIALVDAIYVMLVSFLELERFKAGVLAVCAAIILLSIAEHRIRRRISTEELDGDEREYLAAAWVCMLLGVILIGLEGALEFYDSDIRWFLFEDLVLGVGALAALAEEVRLNRKAVQRSSISASPGNEYGGK